MWIVDTNKEHLAVEEARKLRIPIIGILDSNCDPDLVDFPIPGNDDAIRAVGLLTRVIADAVAEGLIARSGAKTDSTEPGAAEEPLADWERELLGGDAEAAAEARCHRGRRPRGRGERPRSPYRVPRVEAEEPAAEVARGAAAEVVTEEPAAEVAAEEPAAEAPPPRSRLPRPSPRSPLPRPSRGGSRGGSRGTADAAPEAEAAEPAADKTSS